MRFYSESEEWLRGSIVEYTKATQTADASYKVIVHEGRHKGEIISMPIVDVHIIPHPGTAARDLKRIAKLAAWERACEKARGG